MIGYLGLTYLLLNNDKPKLKILWRQKNNG